MPELSHGSVAWGQVAAAMGQGGSCFGQPHPGAGGELPAPPGERGPTAEGLRTLAEDADPAQPPEKGFQRSPRTFLHTQVLARSRKISTSSPQQSFSRGNILPGKRKEEGKAEENPQTVVFLLCNQPELLYLVPA